MKKVSIITVFSLIFSMAFAQVSIRPQIGYNSSNLTNKLEDATFDSQAGFQFGIDGQFGSRFYIQPGIMWESANNELKESIEGTNTDFQVNRVRIPVMFGYKFFGKDTDGIVDIRAFTGPNAAFTISKDLKQQSLISKSDFKGAIFGWNLGVGVDIAIVFVDAGYSFGLSEVFEGAASDVRNNLWYANAGLRLGF
ncbi:MAG: outer membrane beta-barrel protein [Saprospiraceae bacterium]|nr:outer membrane beta-barrel protein [Saprospiraceae bacterium]